MTKVSAHDDNPVMQRARVLEADRQAGAKANLKSQRAEDIRIIALQCAVAGNGANLPDMQVTRRAKAFEQFILDATEAPAGENRAWRMDP